MKKIIYMVLTLVLPLFVLAADNMQALFEKGNKAYAKAQYKDAIADYQQILNAGYQSPAVYYNLANASYKDGDIDHAILFYEKAHKLSPGDEDINFNTHYMYLKTTDKVEEAPEFFLYKWWRSFILGISAKAMAIMSVLLFFIGSVALILYFFTQSVILKKSSFFSSIALFVLGLITVFVAGRQESYFEGHKQAIIFSDIVNVKSAPADKATTSFVLHDGTKVNMMETSNGWIKIKLVNGNQGWIKLSDIKAI